MSRMNIGAAVRIHGTKDVITAAGNIRRAPLAAMRQAAIARSELTKSRLQREMNAEYRSAWATGAVARSIKAKVKSERDGVSVQFSANSGARDHLQYITAAVPGGFDKFPVKPYTMLPVAAKLLVIRMPGHTRNFIMKGNKMAGSRPSKIRSKKVLWGSKSGGFKRDVIMEVLNSEGEAFQNDVRAAVAAALSTVVSYPKKARDFVQDPSTGRLMGARKG